MHSNHTTPPTTERVERLPKPQRRRPATRDGTQTRENISRGEDNRYWGHKLTTTKRPGIFRLCFQNIGGLPVEENHERYQDITASMEEHHMDYLGIIETDLNFKYLHKKAQWRDRFKHVKKQHSKVTYNKHQTINEKKVWGGCGFIMSGSASHRVLKTEEDPSGLGRWISTIVLGRQNIKTRIISAYRPCESNDDRPESVYSQQETYFHSIGEHINPRNAFFKDLDQCMTEWQNNGEIIILGFDANELIHSRTLTNWRLKWGLVNVHQEQHPTKNLPTTCNKNRQRERPIDGVWATPSVNCLRSGMTAYGQMQFGRSADHRMLWLDIQEETIFGYRPPRPHYKKPIRLSLHDPAVVQRYINELATQRAQHRIYEKALELSTTIQLGQFNNDHIRMYNKLDKEDSELRQRAQKKCRKLRMGNVKFSIVVKLRRDERYLWTRISQRLLGVPTCLSTIRRLMRSTGHLNALTLNIQEVEKMIAVNRKEWKKAVRDQDKLREEMALAVNTRRATRNNTTVEVEQKVTKNAFIQKAGFGRIKEIIQKPRISMSMVSYTNSAGTVTECFTKTEIEEACMQEGIHRFTQAHGTPFLSEPLLSDLGPLGDTQAGTDILLGNYHIPEQVDQYTRKFIHQMKIPDTTEPLNMLDAELDVDEHKKGWKKMKERISSSPHAPNFADYKAGALSTRIAKTDTLMANIPFLAGFCPTSWSTAMDVMIPKKSDSSDVKKLRIIVLFHALFNMGNKRIARNLVAQAEKHNLLPHEAYGSRKNHRASECALNKVLTADYIRLTRRPAAICCNDAKSCYDRIVHSVAALCMRRLGVHKDVCKVMFGTMQQMRHYVRTVFGDSENSYSAIRLSLQGVLQGNGAGPAIWLVVSAPLIQMLKDEGFGLHIIDPISGEQSTFVCYTFVDDTDLVHAPTTTTDIRVIQQEMQNMLNHWEGGLKATGGALVVIDKSYWYSISFTWKKNRWHYNSILDTPHDLSVKDHNGNISKLERLEVSQAKETLGLWIAMDGNQDRQKMELIKKIDTWVAKIRTGLLTKTEARLSLKSGIAKSLDYPLTATMLSKANCQEIMRRLVQPALRALGIPFSFPRDIALAPLCFGGLAIPNLWVEQGLAHISTFLRHVQGTAISGRLHRSILSLLRLELGLPHLPFDYTFSNWKEQVTATWMTTLWEFCSDIGLSLVNDDEEWKPYRTNDVFLAQAFLDAGYTPTERYHLNLCRQWSRTIRLSDLVTGDGRSIRTECLSGAFIVSHNDHFKWPKHGFPSLPCWKLWKTAILKHFCIPTEHYQRRLHTPLGEWYEEPSNWQWFYSPQTGKLYENCPQYVQQYVPRSSGSRTRHNIYHKQDVLFHIPVDAVPTTVTGRSNTLRHEGYRKLGQEPWPTEKEYEWWRAQRICVEMQATSLAQGLAQGSAVIVCDGSFKKDLGTAAYIIKPHIDSIEKAIYVCPTPGPRKSHSAYRAETAGILACIRWILTFAKIQEVHNGSILLGCDCQAALGDIFNRPYPGPSKKHADLLSEIHTLLKNNKHIQWNWEHIKGHQDKHLAYENLSPMQQLNVQMDTEAKKYWEKMYHDPNFSHCHLPQKEGIWGIWKASERLTHWDQEEVRKLYFRPAAHEYWETRRSFDPTTIDWEGQGETLRKSPIPMQLFIPKWNTKFLSIGKNLVRWKLRLSDACSRCGQPETHPHHILRCQHLGARQIWKQKMKDLDVWLGSRQTKPDLHKYILKRIKQWYRDPIQPLPTEYTYPSDHVSWTMIASQDDIGWGNFIDGFLHLDWEGVQQAYYEYIGSRKTGRRWVETLIRQFWNIAWDMWVHRCRLMMSDGNAADHVEHGLLDSEIVHLFDIYQHHLEAPQELSRWFIRTPQDLKHESCDFKRQWLQAVRHGFDVFDLALNDTTNQQTN